MMRGRRNEKGAAEATPFSGELAAQGENAVFTAEVFS
jgi:hypothetical protein